MLIGSRSCYGKGVLSRVVMIGAMLVGCGETARPESPPASSPAPEEERDTARGSSLDRAEAGFRGRVRAFLKEGFAVQGLGLPPDELKLLRSEASCQLDAAGFVIACTVIKATGNVKFDAAVTAALEASKGKQTPAPPSDKPGWRTETITMSLRCGPKCS